MQPNWWSLARKHLEKDEVLKVIIETYSGESMHHRGDAFHSLSRSITGQQISVRAAASVWLKLERLAHPVTPENILKFSVEELQTAGLSARKAEYILNVADFFKQNKVDGAFWQSVDYEVLTRLLLPIKGVGRWTIDMFAMFYLFLPDIFPETDLGIIKALDKYYAGNKGLNERERVLIMERYRPYRTAACWYLWRSLDPEPVMY